MVLIRIFLKFLAIVAVVLGTMIFLTIAIPFGILALFSKDSDEGWLEEY